MRISFEQATALQYENQALKRQLQSFRSGTKYVQMRKQYEAEARKMEAEIRKLKKEIARLNAQIVTVRNIWSGVVDDMEREKKRAVFKAQQETRKMEERALRAERKVDSQKDEIRQWREKYYEAASALLEEQEKNRELTARINKDYTNSSKSSSADPNHKKIPNGREKSGKKPGGQPGHPHYPRKQQKPDQVISIPAPEEFLQKDRYVPTGKLLRKQLISVQISTSVTEYITEEFLDRKTGHLVHAEFPAGVINDVNYDGSVKALAWLLNNECYVSIGKTRTFLKEISDGKIELSEGMICNLSRQFSDKTKAERDDIFLNLFSAPVLHADFTFGRMNGKQRAVMVTAADDTVLYQGRETKGHAGIKDTPVELYDGILVSDHEAALVGHGKHHQECMAHIIRYLQSSVENEPEREWNGQMLDLVKKMIHCWKQKTADEPLNQKKVNELINEYDRIISLARKEYEEEPPGKYFMDGYNTYKRMEQDKEDYLLFLKEPSVPPTNNLAERCGRKVKRKVHQVMAFRSEAGFDYFCDGLTISQTVRAKGGNLYREVADRFNQ